MQEGPGAAACGRAPGEISTSFAGANRSRFEGLRSPALSAPVPTTGRARGDGALPCRSGTSVDAGPGPGARRGPVSGARAVAGRHPEKHASDVGKFLHRMSDPQTQCMIPRASLPPSSHRSDLRGARLAPGRDPGGEAGRREVEPGPPPRGVGRLRLLPVAHRPRRGGTRPGGRVPMGALAQASGCHRRGPDGARRQRGRQGDRRRAPARAPLPADGLGLGGTRDDGRNRSPGRAGDAARPAPVHRPGGAGAIRLRNSEPHRHPLRRQPHRRRGAVDRDRQPAGQAPDRGASRPRTPPPPRRLAEPGAGGHPGHSRRPGAAHGRT